MIFSPIAIPSDFKLLLKKLVQLEKTYFVALLLYLILLSLGKALAAHVLVGMTKKALASLSTSSIPQKNELNF